MDAVTWPVAIYMAIGFHSGRCHLNQVYLLAPKIRGLPVGENDDAAIRGTIEKYSSDSDLHPPDAKDLFSSEGKGSGMWALRDPSKTMDALFGLKDMAAVLGRLSRLSKSTGGLASAFNHWREMASIDFCRRYALDVASISG